MKKTTYVGFLITKNMENFEAFLYNITLSTNLLFLKSGEQEAIPSYVLPYYQEQWPFPLICWLLSSCHWHHYPLNDHCTKTVISPAVSGSSSSLFFMIAVTTLCDKMVNLVHFFKFSFLNIVCI